MSISAMKQALEVIEAAIESGDWQIDGACDPSMAIHSLHEAIAEAEKQEPVTLLPDGSAFGVMSFPLPKDHWLYQPRMYLEGEIEPIELPKPIMTHEIRRNVIAAMRYAIRGATNCGKDNDFDPDALVNNAVYALCGPYSAPVHASDISQERVDETAKREQEPAPNDYDRSIHNNPDAQAWAKFFMATVKEQEWCVDDIDESLMTGWFANAMMAMHDHVKREWVGLTDGEIVDLLKECEGRLWSDGFRAIEAKLKEKNS